MIAMRGADFERWEAFYDDGVHRGALTRRYDGEHLLTRITFPLDDEQWYRAESRVAVAPDGSTWSTSRYRQDPGGVDTRRTRNNSDLQERSLPSYAEYLLVRRLADDPGRPIRFQRLDDGDEQAIVITASVQEEGTTTITPPGGQSGPARVITIREGHTIANTHWVAGGQVLGSDWNGATSWPTATLDEAVGDLPTIASTFIRHGFR